MQIRKHKSLALRLHAIAVGASALGAFSLGATALGACAIGALAVRRAAIREARIAIAKLDSVRVRELVVTRLHIGELIRAPSPETTGDDSSRTPIAIEEAPPVPSRRSPLEFARSRSHDRSGTHRRNGI